MDDAVIGRVLDNRYLLRARVGGGGSATVYLAHDNRLDRQVAVKLLLPHLAHDATFLRRFEREARAVGRLENDNVVRVYDWGQDDVGPFLVTEFLGGGSLRQLLDHSGPLSASQALKVGFLSANGLAAAHGADMVHRDIKPGNLLFGDDGTPHVADFGLVRALHEAGLTEPNGVVLGTARYLPPEAGGRSEPTPAGDVYALALSIVEAVTGEVPLAGGPATEVLERRRSRDPEVSEQLGSAAPVLAAALRRDPASRPSAAQLRDLLYAARVHYPRPEPLALVPLLPTVGVAGSDPTMADPGAAGGNGPQGGGVGGDPATSSEPTGSRTALAELTPEPEPATVDVGRDIRRRRRRARRQEQPVPDEGPPRRRRRVLVPLFSVIGLAALVIGAVVLAVNLLPEETPTHEVDTFVNRPLGEVEAVAEAFGWVLVTSSRFDDEVPEGRILEQEPAPGFQLPEGDPLTVVVSDGLPQVEVPSDLLGRSANEVAAALEQAELRVGAQPEDYSEEVPAGDVIDVLVDERSIAGIAELEKFTVVDLVVSRGPQPREVPTLLSMDLETATARAAELQLAVVEGEPAFSDEVPQGRIISQQPSAGDQLERDGTITVVLSRGPDLRVVPEIVGSSRAEAVAALEDVGLRVGEVFGPADGVVFRTSPGYEPGTRHRPGTAVSIYTE